MILNSKIGHYTFRAAKAPWLAPGCHWYNS